MKRYGGNYLISKPTKRLSRNYQSFKSDHLTEKFSVILKRMKEGKKTNLKIKIDEPNEFIEKQEEKEPFLDNAKLENEKTLAKLYKNEFTKTFQNLKKDFNIEKENKKILITATDIKVTKDIMDKPSFSLPKTKKSKYGFTQFNKTNYVSHSSMKEFYSKFAMYNSLKRKYPKGHKTPSWAFIRSTTEEKIIPNPLGLIKRSGDEKILGINNQKVGDKYMIALSNSVRYAEHLESLEFGGNRLSSIGVSHLFKALNDNKNLAPKIKCIDLSENHIGKSQIENLINFLQDRKCNLENLNLYGNFLGNENIKAICDALAFYVEYKLETLNLGKNNISPICTDSILNLFRKCSGLRVFIINHNWLDNNSGTKIIKELTNHFELRTLDLSWNCIGDAMTSELTYESIVNKALNHPERLYNNFTLNETLTTLKLNIRRNPLLPPLDSLEGKKQPQDKKKGKKEVVSPVKPPTEPKKIPEKPKKPSPFAVELGEYFAKTSLSLTHLDISHNNLNYEDCKLIGEKSKVDHRILGIHVDGNCMEINCLGFISPLEELKNEKYYSESQIYYALNKDYALRKTGIEKVRKIRGKNNCWICEGFREIKFEYIPKEPIEDPNNHLVKLHLNFDDYRPFDMICYGSSFQIVRMCPPGEINYFFTVDSIPVKTQAPSGKNNFEKIRNEKDYIKYTFEPDYMEELHNIRQKLLYQKKKENENESEEEENEDDDMNNKDKNSLLNLSKNKITISVDTISKIQVKVNHAVVNENLSKNIFFAEPRPEKIINKFVKPRTPWTFPISIWAYYGYEYEGISEDYYNSCFEFDFDRCQFQKDFKEEGSLAELKKFLRERYRDIIDCYKYYSSMSGFQVWQITQNNLTEFISHCTGMCDIKYDINNIFLTQKTVCGNLLDKEERKKNNRNLSDNIVRHQFMSLLVRAAKDKYVTVLKVTKDPLIATKMAFENHYDQAIKGFGYHKWRMERYYNEPVDNFLKAFLPILDGVYLSVAKQKGPRKKDVWMELDEFNNFVQCIVDINEYPIRDNPIIFNQSINLQVNEIYTDKHLNMLLPEFLEALCRAVDKASPIPPGETKDDWPIQKRQAQPLVKKLENILPVLIKLITHPDLKNLRDKFPMPKKDLLTGLYIIDYENNSFYKDYIIKPGQRSQKRNKTRKQTRARRRSQIKDNFIENKENEEKKEEVNKTINDTNKTIESKDIKKETINEVQETAETNPNENKN